MANRFDSPNADHEQWLQQTVEAPLEPDLPIIDAHHHLWIRDGRPYLLREFAADLHSGHNIVATVFEECHSMYRRAGPEAYRCVGEMEFVAGVAAMSEAGAFDTANVCQVAVGNADLMLGAEVGPVLDALHSASGQRLRAIRASVCWDDSDALHRVVNDPQYLAHAKVHAALQEMAARELTLDCWLYHPQLPQLARIAAGHPDLRIVINHTGTPILGGPYRDRQQEVQQQWSTALQELSNCPNVYMKLGALPARFGRPADGPPPSSEQIAQAWQPWIEPCIEWFGASRCLFESNFPVHKNWMSYPVLWNAFKRIAAGASAEEKQALFAGTAATVYRMSSEH